MVNIILIHGLGGSGFTLKPIKWSLLHPGWIFEYNSTNEISVVLKELDAFIDSCGDTDDAVILVGHSLGGLVATLCSHERVAGIVTVSSPHQSCSMVKTVCKWVSNNIRDYLFGGAHKVLVADPFKPQKPMICITTALLPILKFDGRVWTEEMINPDAIDQLYLPWSDHILQLFDPRMWNLINISIERLIHMTEPWQFASFENDGTDEPDIIFSPVHLGVHPQTPA